MDYYFRRKRLDNRIRKCEICGEEALAVLDHDHLTGLVRGNLCRQCNSWLGVFEGKLRRFMKSRISNEGFRPIGKSKFKVWAQKHREIIMSYLEQHKGFRYEDRYFHEGI